jgi:hypothetical protein
VLGDPDRHAGGAQLLDEAAQDVDHRATTPLIVPSPSFPAPFWWLGNDYVAVGKTTCRRLRRLTPHGVHPLG